MEDIIRLYPLEMEEWVDYCDPIVMHLRDFEMIIEMNFLMQAKVSIMPYLRTLVFMEEGTPCTVMGVGNHAIEIDNGTRLDSSTEHIGGWLEERDNGLAKPWQFLGSRQNQMADDSS